MSPSHCACSPAAKLAYVTPSCQFPLGVTLSLERRLQLIDWAKSQCRLDHRR